jgi:hypothetical protein
VRLARLAHLTLLPATPLHGWRMVMDDMVVNAGTVGGRDGQLVVTASVPLSRRPTLMATGLRVPVAPRRRAEAAIEAAADAVAVAMGKQRTISSPNPYIGRMPETQSELDWMNSTPGFEPLLLEQVLSVGTLDRPLDVVGHLLADRRDGIGLMAEALSHTHATGRFHDLMRVFERAFALGPSAVVEPLTRFLRGAHLGYSRREVAKWSELRGPATHADRRPVVLTEPDLRLPVTRMKQAAYDVLLNKATWRDSSTRRRNRWRPTTGTMSANGYHVFIEQYSAHGESIQAKILDGFGVYPMNLEAGLNRLPDGVWWRGAADTGASRQFRVAVIPRRSPLPDSPPTTGQLA